MSRFPSLVRAFIADIPAALGVRASIEAPADVADLPGFVRVMRGPGDDDGVFDSSLVDFDVFAPDYSDAEILAEGLRAWVLDQQNRIVGGVQIGRVRTGVGPVEVDWGNPNVTRFVYSARVGTRRH